MDYIANPQRTALELDGRDGEVAVIVSHDADALLRRIRSAGGVGVGLTGVGLTRVGLTAVGLAFLGGAPRSGVFLASLLIVLVFLAASVIAVCRAISAVCSAARSVGDRQVV